MLLLNFSPIPTYQKNITSDELVSLYDNDEYIDDNSSIRQLNNEFNNIANNENISDEQLKDMYDDRKTKMSFDEIAKLIL